MGNWKTMKHCILTCLLFLPIISFGQNLTDSLLVTFYNQTLSYYFSDSTDYWDQRKFGYVLVTTDFPTINLIKKVGIIEFKYFDKRTPRNEVLVRPYKKNNARNFYKIYHTSFGTDTLDINIYGSTINKATRKHLDLAVWCGGDMGYIPSGRFIYNKEMRSWIFISSEEIVTEKLKEFK